MDIGLRIECRASQISEKIESRGPQQVRVDQNGRILAYCYPARRGYGVRGMLVGVYDRQALRDWIRDDIAVFLSGRNHAGT